MIDYDVASSVRRKLLEKSPPVSLDEVEEALSDPDLVEIKLSRKRKAQERKMKYLGYTEGGRLLQVYLIEKAANTYLMSAYDADQSDKKLYNRLNGS